MLHPTMLRNILAARLLILCEMEIENMSLSGGKKPNRYDPWYAKAAFGLLFSRLGWLPGRALLGRPGGAIHDAVGAADSASLP